MWAEVKEERFENYQKSGGGGVSMMDHYYDKLLQVNNIQREPREWDLSQSLFRSQSSQLMSSNALT